MIPFDIYYNFSASNKNKTHQKLLIIELKADSEIIEGFGKYRRGIKSAQ